MSRDLLLSQIQGGVRLRPTRTVDKSRPVLKAEIDLPPRQILISQPSYQPETEVEKIPHIPNGLPLLPPPPPPPPLSSSLEPRKVAKPLIIKTPSQPVDRDALLAEIRGGVKLKKIGNHHSTSDNSTKSAESLVEPVKSAKNKPILAVEPLPSVNRKPLKDDWIPQSDKPNVISELRKFSPDKTINGQPIDSEIPVKFEPKKLRQDVYVDKTDKNDSTARNTNGIRKLSPPVIFMTNNIEAVGQPKIALSPPAKFGSFKPDYSGNVAESKKASPTKPVSQTINQPSADVKSDKSTGQRSPTTPQFPTVNESIKKPTGLVTSQIEGEIPPPLPTTSVPEIISNGKEAEIVRNYMPPHQQVDTAKMSPSVSRKQLLIANGDSMIDKTVPEGSDLTTIKRILLDEYVNRSPTHLTSNSTSRPVNKINVPPALNDFVDAKSSQNGSKTTQVRSPVDNSNSNTRLSPVRAEPHKTGLIPRVSDMKQKYEDITSSTVAVDKMKKSATFQTPLAYSANSKLDSPPPVVTLIPTRLESPFIKAERVENESSWKQGRAVVATVPIAKSNGFVRATPATVIQSETKPKLNDTKKWRSVAELKVEREVIVPVVTTTTSIHLENNSNQPPKMEPKSSWKSYKTPDPHQGYTTTSRVETTVVSNGYGGQYVRKTAVISSSRSAENLLDDPIIDLQQISQIPVEQLKSRLKFKIDLDDLNSPIGIEYRN